MNWLDSPVWLCSLVRKVRRPVIGIMARPRVSEGVLIGKQGPVLMKYLVTAKRLHTLACVFDPHEVDVSRQRLTGYVLDASAHRDNPQVQKVDLPIPMVIYDQLLSRRYENAKDVSKVRAFLKTRAHVFNDGYFDKWEVYQWLSVHPQFRPVLPKTELLTSAAPLRRLLHEYPTVFVKPIHGSLGLGIVKITRVEGGYEAVLRTKEGNSDEGVFASAQDVYNHFRKRWQASRHIAQQGLNLYAVGGRPVDVRVIMQKNGEGQWQSTKIFVRMAGSGEFISNLTTGGEAMPLSQLGKSDKNIKIARIKRDIRQLVSEVPVAIEQGAARTLGEMGIDIGLCESGRPQIIEVNSKPWKTPETVNGSTELVELSFERPIRFALHLAHGTDVKGGAKS
ncbi:MAG: YheC/YheD family protein [Firmicutes bacterium]|nr:YheC/YheD family protein [Bacillota bacterium]